MYVIRRYCAPYDRHVPCLADLSDQVARTLCHSPAEYLISVFRAPDHVTLKIEDRVRATSVFGHAFPLSEGGKGRWKQTASKAVGLDRADRAKNRHPVLNNIQPFFAKPVRFLPAPVLT